MTENNLILMDTSTANDVFISYTQHDKVKAHLIHDLFQTNDLKSWIDKSQSGVQPGMHYGGDIVRAIADSRVFVLVYSGSCNGSPDILTEVEHFPKNRPRIILRLDNSAYDDNLSYHLKVFQHIDATLEPWDTVKHRLWVAVNQALKRQPQREAATTDQLLFLDGLKALREERYADAVTIFQQYGNITANDRQYRFYLALALIEGRQTKRLDGLVVKKLEAILQPAIIAKGDHIHILLAIIKHGYYALNGFKVPPPSVDQLLQTASIDKEKTVDLLAHLNEPENNFWRQLQKNHQK